MLHISELGEHGHRFVADQDGNVPEPGDHWQDMNFEHGLHDPHEAGISEEERARRIAYLNEHWWPQVIARVNQEKEALARLPEGSPIKKWRQDVMREPPAAHGFEVE